MTLNPDHSVYMYVYCVYVWRWGGGGGGGGGREWRWREEHMVLDIILDEKHLPQLLSVYQIEIV